MRRASRQAYRLAEFRTCQVRIDDELFEDLAIEMVEHFSLSGI
jgi:hypothetical protein